MVAKYIRKYMWEGGKHNEKKHHLINWTTVRLGRSSVGLAIKDLHLMNIALGAKIAWHSVNNEHCWWKEALTKTYLIGRQP